MGVLEFMAAPRLRLSLCCCTMSCTPLNLFYPKFGLLNPALEIG